MSYYHGTNSENIEGIQEEGLIGRVNEEANNTDDIPCNRIRPKNSELIGEDMETLENAGINVKARNF